jgi:hypothetical protein
MREISSKEESWESKEDFLKGASISEDTGFGIGIPRTGGLALDFMFFLFSSDWSRVPPIIIGGVIVKEVEGEVEGESDKGERGVVEKCPKAA